MCAFFEPLGNSGLKLFLIDVFAVIHFSYKVIVKEKFDNLGNTIHSQELMGAIPCSCLYAIYKARARRPLARLE